jgi:hypothetical protein
MRIYLLKSFIQTLLEEKTYGRFSYEPDYIDFMDTMSAIDLGYGEGKPAPISNVVEIYRLEYITDQIRRSIQEMKKKGQQPAFKTTNKLSTLEQKLESLLDNENELIAFVMHIWASYDVYAGSAKLWRETDWDEVKSCLQSDGKYEHPKQYFHIDIADKLQQKHTNLSWQQIQKEFPDDVEQAIEASIQSFHSENEQLLVPVENAERMLKNAHTLGQKRAAFFHALQIVHGGGKMARNVYGEDATNQLEMLSSGPRPEWEAEAKRAVSVEATRRVGKRIIR